MNFDGNIVISIEKLKIFIYKAKINAFAANASKISLTDQTSVFSFRDFDNKTFGGYIYNDKYNGNIVEGGQESISIDLATIWRNQYYGGTQYNSVPHRKDIKDLRVWSKFVNAFLQQALMQLPKEFPVRGPAKFSTTSVFAEGKEITGKWEYTNKWENIPLFKTTDPFASFRGFETIKLDGKEVFWHAYHGGLIYDKYFPFLIKERAL